MLIDALHAALELGATHADIGAHDAFDVRPAGAVAVEGAGRAAALDKGEHDVSR
jgi:hypothetical protein